jgi:hypothetical protein
VIIPFQPTASTLFHLFIQRSKVQLLIRLEIRESYDIYIMMHSPFLKNDCHCEDEERGRGNLMINAL